MSVFQQRRRKKKTAPFSPDMAAPIVLRGYHYTPEATAIKVMAGEGLIPQPVTKQETLDLNPNCTGTWVWQFPLSPESHAGTVIFQAATKMATRIALLEVDYTMEDVARDAANIGFMTNKHNGNVGNWEYHRAELGYILTGVIPVERIRLIAVYDIVEMLAHRPGVQLRPSKGADHLIARKRFDWRRFDR